MAAGSGGEPLPAQPKRIPEHRDRRQAHRECGEHRRQQPAVEDISLSFTADSWSRTFRSKAIAVATESTITTRYGLQVVPDAIGTAPGASLLPAPETTQPARSLPSTLEKIGERFGENTARFVALQLEYPWSR